MRVRLRLPRLRAGPVTPASTLWALIVGGAGGLVAQLLGLPLPMLLGSVVAVGTVALADIGPGELRPLMPSKLRLWFIPVIGVTIGAAFTPQILENAWRWWPSLLGLFVFIPAAHWAGYVMLHRVGGLSRQTAYFGAVPGGLIETVMMGEEAGADTRMLTMLQLMRLILCIVFIPLGFSLITGGAVGSSAGVSVAETTGLSWADWGTLALAGIVGVALGHKMPAGFMTGPLLASGVVHLLGWVEGAPPAWMVSVTQLVVGTSLGGRFAGMELRSFFHAIRLSAANVVLILVMAGIAAAALHGAVDERWEAVFLAYAPGGLAEMSLVALSLEISAIYVTAHHVARIVMSVAMARLFAHRVADG